MPGSPIVARVSAAAFLVALAAASPVRALSMPDGPLLALDSVNRPVLRELADIKAREEEKLGKIEGRLDERMARLERALVATTERAQRESRSSVRELAFGLGERLADLGHQDRLLLLAVAGGYLWSALLWIELRRVTRTVRDAAVRQRYDRIYSASSPPGPLLPRPGNGKDVDGLSPPV